MIALKVLTAVIQYLAPLPLQAVEVVVVVDTQVQARLVMAFQAALVADLVGQTTQALLEPVLLDKVTTVGILGQVMAEAIFLAAVGAALLLLVEMVTAQQAQAVMAALVQRLLYQARL
jgi:hypothetical protein